MFPRNTAEPAIELPLSVHLTNWQSAEEDPALTESWLLKNWRKAGYLNIQAPWSRLNKNFLMEFQWANWELPNPILALLVWWWIPAFVV